MTHDSRKPGPQWSEFIDDRDKPLALYVFTQSDEIRHRIADAISSGGLGHGLPLAHLTVGYLTGLHP